MGFSTSKQRFNHPRTSDAVLVHGQQPGTAHLPRALHAAIQSVPHTPVVPQALDRDTRLPLQRIEYTERLGARAIVHDMDVPNLPPERINGLPNLGEAVVADNDRQHVLKIHEPWRSDRNGLFRSASRNAPSSNGLAAA